MKEELPPDALKQENERLKIENQTMRNCIRDTSFAIGVIKDESVLLLNRTRLWWFTVGFIISSLVDTVFVLLNK